MIGRLLTLAGVVGVIAILVFAFDAGSRYLAAPSTAALPRGGDAPTNAPTAVLFDWETEGDTEGWLGGGEEESATPWRTEVAQATGPSDGRAKSGTGSLRLRVITPSLGWLQAQAYVDGCYDWSAGGDLAGWAYLPATPAADVLAILYFQDAEWGWYQTGWTRLVPMSWTPLRFPNAPITTIRTIGFDIGSNRAYAGDVYLDYVTGPSPTTSPPTTTLSWLRVAGNRIVNEGGQPVLLRGVNRSGLESTRCPAYFNRSDVDYITGAWQANIIRVSLNQDWVLHQPSYLTTIDSIVGWAEANGAYVLLTLQWLDTTRGLASLPDADSAAMWRQMASRYADEPAVLYDIYTEPHNTSWDAWHGLATQLIDAIRTVHPKALVFVSGVDWGHNLSGVATKPITHSNVVYSVHDYPGPSLRHQAWGYLTPTHPVFVAEWGCDAEANAEDLSWGSDFVRYADAGSIGWTAWSWVNWPELQVSGPPTYTTTLCGQLVRDALVGANFGRAAPQP